MKSEIQTIASIKRLTDALKKMESITLYPIHLYIQDTLYYPPVENIKYDPFTSDSLLLTDCKNNENFVYDRYDDKIYYCSTKLADHIFCIIGPLSITVPDRSLLHGYLRAHHMDGKYNYPIRKATVSQAFDALNLICEISAGYGIRKTNKTTDELCPKLNMDSHTALNLISEKENYNIQHYILEETEASLPHFPHQIEAHLLESVQNGDMERFNYYREEAYKYSIGNFAKSNYKITEYTAVSAVAVLTRTVMQTDVPADVIYATSDRMLYRLSHMTKEEEILKFTDEVYSTFVNMVKQYQQKDSGPLYVRKCKNYIIKHLNKPITLEEIAENSGISVSYLSHIFQKHEGCTVMNYVQSERIRVAANMLTYSDYSIIRIANYFQFQTQSHFSAVFKKHMHMSPAAYRREYARE